jgi:serine/threonine protein kinase
MNERWSDYEIEDILKQLDQKHYLFRSYTFITDNGHLKKVGTGGSAVVYEMKHKNNDQQYVLKVVGFKTPCMNVYEFNKITNLQENLKINGLNVVKIYHKKILLVWFEGNTVKAVKKVDDQNQITAEKEHNFLELEFILMEKLEPVLIKNQDGQVCLITELYGTDEKMKLLHQIGKTLEKAHNAGMMHNDMKLENILYDRHKKVYKLADFGFSKISTNGFVEIKGRTAGYAAPEVIDARDRYFDVTADIYSFGMVSYLLFHNLKFPGSNNYHVNLPVQYQDDYVFPLSQETNALFSQFLLKMCAFHPTDRYQSMGEVMNELEGIMFGDVFLYKKDHQKAYVMIIFLAYFLGAVLLACLRLNDLKEQMWVETVFYLIVLITSLVELYKKKQYNSVSFILSVLCLFVFVTQRKSFIWLFILMLSILATKRLKIIISITYLVESGALFLAKIYHIHIGMPAYWSIAGIACLTLCAALDYEYTFLEERMDQMNTFFFKYHYQFFAPISFLICVFLLEYTRPQFLSVFHFIRDLPYGQFVLQSAQNGNLLKGFSIGVLLYLLWQFRIYLLVAKAKKKRSNEEFIDARI